MKTHKSKNKLSKKIQSDNDKKLIKHSIGTKTKKQLKNSNFNTDLYPLTDRLRATNLESSLEKYNKSKKKKKRQKHGKSQLSFSEAIENFKKVFDDKRNFCKTNPSLKKDNQQVNSLCLSDLDKKRKVQQPKKVKNMNKKDEKYRNKGFVEIFSTIQEKLKAYPGGDKSHKKGQKSRDKKNIRNKSVENKCKKLLTKHKAITFNKYQNKNLQKNKQDWQKRLNLKINMSVKQKNLTEPLQFSQLIKEKWQISQDQNNSSDSQSNVSHSSMIIHQNIGDDDANMQFLDRVGLYHSHSINSEKQSNNLGQNKQQQKLSFKFNQQDDQENVNQTQTRQINDIEIQDEGQQKTEIKDIFEEQKERLLKFNKNLQKIKEGGNIDEQTLNRIIEEAQKNHLVLKYMQIKNKEQDSKPKNCKESQSQKQVQKSIRNKNEQNQSNKSNKNINININISNQGIRISSPQPIQPQSKYTESPFILKHKLDFDQDNHKKENNQSESSQNHNKIKKLSYDQAPLQIKKILHQQTTSQQLIRKRQAENEKKLLEDISLLQFMSAHNSVGTQSIESSSFRKMKIEEQIHRSNNSGLRQKLRIKPNLRISLFGESSSLEHKNENIVQIPDKIRSYVQKAPINFIKKYDVQQKPQKDYQSSKQLTYFQNQQPNHIQQPQICLINEPEEQCQSIQPIQNQHSFNQILLQNVGIPQKLHQIPQSFDSDTILINNTQDYYQSQNIQKQLQLHQNNYKRTQLNLFISEAKQYSSKEQQSQQYSSKQQEPQSEINANNNNLQILQGQKQKQIATKQEQQIKERSVYQNLLPWLNKSQEGQSHMNSPSGQKNQDMSFNLYLNRNQEINEFVRSSPNYSADSINYINSLVIEDLIEEGAMDMFQISLLKSLQQCILKKYIYKMMQSSTNRQLNKFIDKNSAWEAQYDNIQIINYTQAGIERDNNYIKNLGMKFLQFCLSNYPQQIYLNISKPLGVKTYELLQIFRLSLYESNSEEQKFFEFKIDPDITEPQIQGYESIINLDYISTFQQFYESTFQKQSQKIQQKSGNQQFFNQAIFDFICNKLDELRPYGKRGLPPLNFYQNNIQLQPRNNLFQKVLSKIQDSLQNLKLIKLGAIDIDYGQQRQLKLSLDRFLKGIVKQIEEDWQAQNDAKFEFQYEIINDLQTVIFFNQILQLKKLIMKRQLQPL